MPSRVLAWLLPLVLVIFSAACGSDIVATSPSTSALEDSVGSTSTEPPSLKFDDGVKEATESAAADPEASVAVVEEEAMSSGGVSPSATDFDQLYQTVVATCEPTVFYGVRAFTGIDDLWYHVDAQWIELSTGLMFTNYVTVNDGTGTEVGVEQIPTDLLVVMATSTARICFDESNDLASFDYDDPGLYDPYDIVPRGGQARPPWPGG